MYGVNATYWIFKEDIYMSDMEGCEKDTISQKGKQMQDYSRKWAEEEYKNM